MSVRDDLHRVLMQKQRDSGSTSNEALIAAMDQVDQLIIGGDEAGARNVVESFVPSMEGERGKQRISSAEDPESRTSIRDRLAGRGSNAHG